MLAGRATVLEEAVNDLHLRETIGIAIHKTTGAITRIGNKSDVATGSYIGDDASPLLSQCAPVVLTNDGTEYKEISKIDVRYHVDGTLVDMTGGNGQIMTRHIPGYRFDADIGDFVVIALSHVEKDGFSLGRAFPGNNSFYSGFYEGSAVPGESVLSSIALDPRDGTSPVWPLTSATGDRSDEWSRASMTTEAIRLLAAARGAGWTTEKYAWWEWASILALIAFGSMNVQSFLGDGRTGLSGGLWVRDSDNTNQGYIGRCGLSNDLQGYAVQDSAGFLTAVSRLMWRENSYGNIWQMLPDVVVDASDAGAVTPYVKDDPPYSTSSTEGYETLKQLDGSDLILPGSNGYKGAPVAGHPLHSAVSTGDSTKFLGDYFYVTITSSLRGALVGGNSFYGSAAGVGAWHSYSSASYSHSSIGSRAGFQNAG